MDVNILWNLNSGYSSHTRLDVWIRWLVSDSVWTTLNTNRKTSSLELENAFSYIISMAKELWEIELNKYNVVPQEMKIFLSGWGKNVWNNVSKGPVYLDDDRLILLPEYFFWEFFEKKFKTSDLISKFYIVVHEISHHIQNTLGIMGAVEDTINENPKLRTKLIRFLELHADFLAWYILWKLRREEWIMWENQYRKLLETVFLCWDDQFGDKNSWKRWEHGLWLERRYWFYRWMNTAELTIEDITWMSLVDDIKFFDESIPDYDHKEAA